MAFRFTILIFDSGVGGLSIYDKIRQVLPSFHFVYVFDNAFFPYGEREENFVLFRTSKIISSVQKQFPLALAVVACNTASTISLPFLQEKFSFPIIGVVPAIRSAISLTKNGVIGLLATRSTIRRPYVYELIEHFATNCKVIMLGSAELVELAELKLRGEVVSLMDLFRVLQPWFCMPTFPDTIVLGCTHFSLLQEELLSVLPIGTYLVDSGQETACYISRIFVNEIRNEKPIGLNNVFCTSLTEDVKRLLPAFLHYGFKVLDQLVL